MSHPTTAHRPVFLDWETRSRIDLTETGGWVYAHDDNSEVVCGVAQLPDGSTHAWAPWPFTPPAGATGWDGVLPPPVVIDAALAHGVCAHNAEGFDRLVWEQLDLPPVRWWDSQLLARRRGLPGKLETMSQILFGEGKDKAGERLMHLVCKPRNGKLLDPAPLVLTQVVRYCAKDVALIARAWDLERMGYSHVDDRALALDVAINRRGVLVDREWLTELEQAAVRYQRETIAHAETFGVTLTMLRSPKALVAWFRERGVLVGDIQARTMEWVMNRSDVPPEAVAIAEARLAVARVTLGKIHKARVWMLGGRLHGLFAYYAAHTGRWGGRGPQPQNLPRPPKGLGDTRPRDGLAFARAKGIPLGNVYGAMLRGILIPDPGFLFAGFDFSQVEARGVLWLAKDQRGLDRFRAGDPYVPMAAAVYGIDPSEVTPEQRTLGKILVLSMGYGGGEGALVRSAEKNRLNLATLGVNPQDAVEAWRDAHPKVAGKRTGALFTKGPKTVVVRKGGLWRRLYSTAKGCVLDGIASDCAGIQFAREGQHMIVTLPSGRPLVYRNVRSEMQVPKWGGEPKPALVWDSPKGPRTLWSGLLVENVTQAICRDLLVAAMLRVQDAGYEIALHVHDELVALVPEQDAETHLARVGELMQTVPHWADGFPIAAEGALRRRYGK